MQVDELTSPQLIESIFDIYFQFCHNQPYSLFHEGRLRDRLRSGSLPDYMIYAISAYALRFSQGSLFGDRTEQIMESYAVTAWLRLVIRWNSGCDEPTDLPIVQTMLLLSIIDFSSKLSSLNLAYVLLSDKPWYRWQNAPCLDQNRNRGPRMPIFGTNDRARSPPTIFGKRRTAKSFLVGLYS